MSKNSSFRNFFRTVYRVEKIRNYSIGISILVGVGLVIFVFLAETGVFGGLSKGGSLSLTNFETLNYPVEGKGFLACDDRLCPGSIADAPLYTFDTSPAKLRNIFIELSDINPDITLRDLDMAKSIFDFQIKEPKNPFPVVLSIKVISIDGHPMKSAVAIYSRSVIGKADPINDKERVLDWVRYAERKIKS